MLFRSFRLRDGRELTVTYNEAASVKHPIVAVAESTMRGNWYVFGPNTQCMVRDGQGLQQALAATSRVELVKDQGVYWLDCDQVQQLAQPAFPLCATRPARPPELAGTAPEEGQAGPAGSGADAGSSDRAEQPPAMEGTAPTTLEENPKTPKPLNFEKLFKVSF